MVLDQMMLQRITMHFLVK